MARVDRLTYAGLAFAMAASAAVLLWATRGLFFFSDEVGWFSSAPPDYEARALLLPHNTHLIALPRAIYATSLHLFGPDYLPLRVIAVAGVLLCAGLFFVLARRRIGAVALLPTVVLLFLGTSWDVIVSPVGIPFLYAVAGGLGALLAVERRDRRGDIAACALLTLATASHTFGLVFLVGVAASILLDRNRLRRLWAFVLPLALYALWWVLSSSTGTGDSASTLAQASNVVLLPLYGLLSVGAAIASILGLNLAIDPPVPAGFNRMPPLNWTLAPVLALAALVLLVVRLRRGGVDQALWAFLATLVTFALAIGLSTGPERPPTAARYVFPGAVIVLLVAVEAARGLRFSRPVVVALAALTVLSVAVNLVHIRDARRFLLAYAANAPPALAMVELASADVEPLFRAGVQARGVPKQLRVPAKSYLRGAATWGSIAAPLERVRRGPAVVRDRADVVLAEALGLRLTKAAGRSPAEECRTVGGGEPATLPVAARGMTLRSLERETAEVRLRRFGDSFSASVGRVAPGQTVLLAVPEDGASEPWEASLAGSSIEVCVPRSDAAADARYCQVRARLDRNTQKLRRGIQGRARERIIASSRQLLIELQRFAAPEIKRDVRTTVAASIGAPVPGVEDTQRRVDEFEARRCAPPPGD